VKASRTPSPAVQKRTLDDGMDRSTAEKPAFERTGRRLSVRSFA
jgi:hypothetical protein